MGNSFYSTIKKDKDGWTILENRQGRVLAESNTTPETVFQAGFDRKGDCKIELPPSGYDMSASFAGLKIKSETIIYSTYNTYINVPQGYTGGCLIFDTTYNAGTIRDVDLVGGLSISEQGTPAKQYSGIKYDGNRIDDGLTFGEFGNVHLYHCKRGLELNFNAAGSWLSTFKFKQIKCYYTAILCDVLNSSGQSPLGLSSNHFDYVGIQSSTNTAYGFRAMRGNNNLFTNCAVWDVQNSTVAPGAFEAGHPGGVISAQFMPDATNQYILGGIMTHSQYDNQAKPGQVRDMSAHGPAAPMFDVLKQTISVSGPTDGRKTISIPHGMGLAPKWAIVMPRSNDAMTSQFRRSGIDTTNILITYVGAPPVPTSPGNANNLVYEVWTSVR